MIGGNGGVHGNGNGNGVVRLSRRERSILELLLAVGEMAGLELVAASPLLGRGTVYVALRRLADRGLVDSRRSQRAVGMAHPQRLFRATSLAGVALAAGAPLVEAPAW